MIRDMRAAFCNTGGGELLIGVGDDQTILGIEHDHFANNDKFLLHLRNLVTDKPIPASSNTWITRWSPVAINGFAGSHANRARITSGSKRTGMCQKSFMCALGGRQ